MTRFVAKATVSQIESYYKDIMSREGWSLDKDSVAEMTFNYSRGTQDGVIMYGAAIQMQHLPGRQTQVELQVEGVGISPTLTPRHPK